LVERDAAIIDLCRGKRVLHLGADAPFHASKAAAGELLHTKVAAVARELIGLDSDTQAVRELQWEYGVSDIVPGDAADPPIGALERDYDVVLACDIIEHVPDAGRLLRSCRAVGRGANLVVTTINATGAKPALRALFRREAVHPDHVAYYSYSTLCQLLQRVGYKPTLFGAFLYPSVRRSVGVAFSRVARFSPGIADGIVIVANDE